SDRRTSADFGSDHRPHGCERRRPRHRTRASRRGIDELNFLEIVRHEVDGFDYARIARRRGPFVIAMQQAVGSRFRQRHLEGEEQNGQIAVEIFPVMLRGELDAGAHPLALGVGYLADPTVLQSAEQDDSEGEGGERDERRDRATARLHAVESSIRICAKIEGPCGFYVSYKALSSG